MVSAYRVQHLLDRDRPQHRDDRADVPYVGPVDEVAMGGVEQLRAQLDVVSRGGRPLRFGFLRGLLSGFLGAFSRASSRRRYIISTMTGTRFLGSPGRGPSVATSQVEGLLYQRSKSANHSAYSRPPTVGAGGSGGFSFGGASAYVPLAGRMTSPDSINLWSAWSIVFGSTPTIASKSCCGVCAPASTVSSSASSMACRALFPGSASGGVVASLRLRLRRSFVALQLTYAYNEQMEARCQIAKHDKSEFTGKFGRQLFLR